MQIGDTVEAELVAEESYDGDYDYLSYVEHNHFVDCPVCGKEYARTDIYYELAYDDTEISCCECNAEFLRVSECWYSDLKLKITKLLDTN